MIPKGQLCQKCEKNKAIIEYTEGMLAWSHGFVEYLCEECYEKKQKETPLYKKAREQAFKDVEKLIDEKIISLNKEEQYWNDKKLKAFEDGDKYEGMYLGKAEEIRHIINIFEELKKELEKMK